MEIEPADEPVEVEPADEYVTRGKTRLATKRGYRFQPSNQDLPEITPAGINMTAVQATEVLAESRVLDGRVYRVDTEKEN